jgi:chemotaxis response regulator CheB
MPMAVAKANVADQILSIDDIRHRLVHEFESQLDEAY